jgi:hypothetical protein
MALPAAELKARMRALGLSMAGCDDKADLVHRLTTHTPAVPIPTSQVVRE